MKAYRLTGGDLASLNCRMETVPVPAVGEVQVAMKAAAMNYRDIGVASGTYTAAPNLIPLSDGSGTIIAVGAGVEGFAVVARLGSSELFLLAVVATALMTAFISSAVFGLSLALGAFFVLFQGTEWLGLIREGLTLRSSTYGAFFYLIVGAHALHAVAAISCLAWAWARLRQGILSDSEFKTVQVFWYFVVLVWPIIYFQVYL